MMIFEPPNQERFPMVGDISTPKQSPNRKRFPWLIWGPGIFDQAPNANLEKQTPGGVSKTEI